MTETYLNPLHGQEFPDPFVLKFCGEYWAYGSGTWRDDRRFGILHSRDLVHWEDQGGALEPLPGGFTCYWAPEVSYYNGHFYLYYSVGNETFMEIRVAVAEHPAGPFVDSGRRLTKEEFAIDAHVFQDEDGSRYLFYATDYLQHSHIGTGTAVDRLLDPFTLEGKPHPVSRARYDWQVYDPQRAEKGGVRWHTIEGPFVLKHKGRYYQMFSGGNWHNVSYGVSYALSSDLTNPDEWEQVADGQKVLPILRTLPGQVIGPGHNSVVRGPDNRQLYCVYHRWALDGSARLLAIDPLDWAGERMLIIGPSTGPEPAPIRPTVSGFDPAVWSYGQDWLLKDNVLQREGAQGSSEASLNLPSPYFVAEISLKALPGQPASGICGITLHNSENQLLRLELEAGQRQARVISPEGKALHQWNLPPEFNFEAFHLLWLEVVNNRVKLALDEGKQISFDLPEAPSRLSLFGESAAFAGYSLTVGWQDLFDQAGSPENYGWQTLNGGTGWQVQEQQLQVKAGNQPAMISKGPLLTNYELVINARLVEQTNREGGYGFYPAWLSEAQPGPLIRLEQTKSGWVLCCEAGEQQDHPLALQENFDPFVFQQFRLRKQGNRLALQWENTKLGEIEVAPGAARLALQVQEAGAAFDMVRVTALPD